MAVWVAEAADPQDWVVTCFSNIVYESGHWVVYVGGVTIAKFYRYNLDTNVFTELTDPPAALYGQLAVSPDGTKVAGHAIDGTQIFIYNVSLPGWTSAVAPDMTGGYTSLIYSMVWADDDTVWCQVRAYDGSNWRVKFYKYTVSTPAWTQYANYLTPAVTNSYCLCISTDGTRLYAGNCGATYYSTVKYTIATDTIEAGPETFPAYYFVLSADRHKLWFGPKRFAPVTHMTITRWVNPDTEVRESGVFPEYDPATKPSALAAGVYGLTMCIAGFMTAAPENLSISLVSLPTVTTDAASAIDKEQATLNGTLDDDGEEACDVRFQYGETIDYGIDTEWQSGKESVIAFEQAIAGLSPNTTYHFRAQARNSAGTVNGDDRTFTTLVAAPSVTTNPATALSAIAATLNGTLDDDGGEACDVRFQYGETGDYGIDTEWQSGKESVIAFEQAITGLLPNTTYHFRAVAKNSAGTSYGADRTFKTLVAVPTVTTEAASAIGLNQATLNGTLDSDGGEPCYCGFEWGATIPYSTTTPTQRKVTGEVFSQPILNLGEAAQYHFRAFATNSAGTAYGEDRTIDTLFRISKAYALARHEV